jgi:Ca2+-binding EF-hand superfamily protein
MIAATDRKELLSKKNLLATFKMIDKEGSNALSAEMLKDFFMGDDEGRTEWDDETWNLLVKEVDANADGLVIIIFFIDFKISPQEFKQIMSKFV